MPLALGIAYFAAAELGHLLTAAGAPIATLWPSAGVFVAALLLTPVRHWPALAAAAFAANFASDTLLHGRAPVVSLGFCAANGAEALLGAWLARRFASQAGTAQPVTFHDRLRGILALLAGAVLAGPALGATLGAGVAHHAFGEPFGQTWALWWSGDALGVLVIAPILLGAFGTPRFGTAAVAERLAVMAVSAAVTAGCLLLLPPQLRVLVLAIPPMVWGAVRLGSCGVAASLLGTTAAAVAAAAVPGAEHLAVPPYGALFDVVRTQVVLVVSGATCHLLAAVATERAAALRRAEAAEERLRLAVEGAGMATFDTDWGTGDAVWSRGRFAMLGYPPPDGPEGVGTVAMANDRLHPQDRAPMLARLEEARRTGLPYTALHRVVRADDGRVRRLEVHGRFIGAGAIAGRERGERNVGVVFDVTAQSEAEERERLLLHEVEHRAKNSLQVVRSLLHATPFADRDAFVAAVDARLGAMARAHTLLSGARWSGADLREVAAAELCHLLSGREGEDAPPRVALRDPAPVLLRPEAAQGMAMVLHELATNAAKHGALSAPGGRVEVSWEAAPSGGVSLRWSESGGPPAGGPPARAGFGSRLIAMTARGQLGGGAEYRWRPEGLLVEVEIAPDRLDGVAA